MSGAPPPTPEPTPSPPPEPRPRRWAPRRWILVVGLVLIGLLVLAWRRQDRLVDALAEVGHALAGIGDLEHWDGKVWVAVDPADAVRRQWGAVDVFLEPAWRSAGAGLDIAVQPLRRSPNPQVVDIALVRADPRAWDFHVRAGAEAPVADFAARHGFSVAINAAFFSDEGPLGLVISDGRRTSRAVRHRAAHFLVFGRTPQIRNERGADTTGAREGFQGFPSLMNDGRVYSYLRVGGRGFDVWTVDRRSAACVDRQGRVILLATDTLTNGLTFDELATVLGGLGCVDAMGFDGGSSTSLVVRVAGAEREVPGLRPVQVVLGLTPRGAAPR